jgi:hypothetical protein
VKHTPDNPLPACRVSSYELAWEGDAPTLLCRVRQRDKSDLWAIRRLSSTLNRDGEWEYEPIPSSRDDEYMARNRYQTAGEAYLCWLRVIA